MHKEKKVQCIEQEQEIIQRTHIWIDGQHKALSYFEMVLLRYGKIFYRFLFNLYEPFIFFFSSSISRNINYQNSTSLFTLFEFQCQHPKSKLIQSHHQEYSLALYMIHLAISRGARTGENWFYGDIV